MTAKVPNPAGLPEGTESTQIPVDPYRFAPDPERYRRADHGWLTELDEVSVHAGAPHARMGTRRIALDQWLVVDEHYHHETALRRRLVGEVPHEVVAAIDSAQRPPGDASCLEAADLVNQALATVGIGGPRGPAGNTGGGGPQVPGGDASGGLQGSAGDAAAVVEAGQAAAVIPSPGVRALTHAVVRSQEDVCLMERDDDGRWRLTVGVVCFPTYWRLGDKIGRDQAAVHAPVPYYSDALARRVPTFFDRLRPETVVMRRNWGLNANPLLFAPDPAMLRQPERFVLEDIWFRSERQTLRRLPATEAVVFTIKVQQCPLSALEAYRPLVGQLVAAIESWPPDLMAARGGNLQWFAGAVQWLRHVL